jgi:hypothetical protein
MKLFPTCREVTRVVLEGEDRALKPLEVVSLRLHWLHCETCRRFRAQNRLMRQALDRWKRDANAD